MGGHLKTPCLTWCKHRFLSLTLPLLSSHPISPSLSLLSPHPVSPSPPPGGLHSPGFESSDSLSCQPLMSADGLYLASYYALLLNLKLCCTDFYRRRTLPPAVSLVRHLPTFV